MNFDRKISGLMSVHHGTDVSHFQICMASIFGQTLSLAQFVLVIDGQVSSQLKDIIAGYGDRITVVPSSENLGLGTALNLGLDACRHPLIARFDSDDVYPEDRLKLQAHFLAEHPEIQVLGGQIAEFEDSPGDLGRMRKVPAVVGADGFTLLRNPLNHMTVMFRREAIRNIDGYSPMRFMQDYELWLRCLSHGYKIANLPDTLAHARIGSGGELYDRRRGLKNMQAELRIFIAKMEAYRYYWLPIIVAVFSMRLLVRLFPSGVLKSIYNTLLRA